MAAPEDNSLSPQDRDALDALIESGMDLASVPSELRERAERVARVMGLLDALPEEDAGDDLIARTLAAVSDATMRSTVEPVTLHDADAAAVDAWVEAGYDAGAVADEHHESVAKVSSLLGTLDALPDERTGDLLVPRTLEAIAQSRRAAMLDQHVNALASGQAPRGGLRLSELGAVAAVFLIGLSVLWPVLTNYRSSARQIACETNLQDAGVALGAYASDYTRAMPAVAAHLGDTWWETNRFNPDGTARSNSAHLYALVKGKYVKVSDFACPTNVQALVKADPDARDWPTTESISYSYQNQYTTERHKMGADPKIAVLADKNPMFTAGNYRFGLDSRDANSANHGSATGQNVLMTDGTVQWMKTPRLANDDNIYHAGLDGFDNYTGLEGPADESDSFLVP